MASPEQLLEKQKLAHQAWTEHIRKELANIRLNTQFIPNPYTMDIITDKPTRTNPIIIKSMSEYLKVAKQEAEQNNRDVPGKSRHIRQIIMSRSRTPKEKWELPLTTSHEYGWDQSAHQPSPQWYKGRGSTGLTQYVQAYILSQGTSPFAKKNTTQTNPSKN